MWKKLSRGVLSILKYFDHVPTLTCCFDLKGEDPERSFISTLTRKTSGVFISYLFFSVVFLQKFLLFLWDISKYCPNLLILSSVPSCKSFVLPDWSKMGVLKVLERTKSTLTSREKRGKGGVRTHDTTKRKETRTRVRGYSVLSLFYWFQNEWLI